MSSTESQHVPGRPARLPFAIRPARPVEAEMIARMSRDWIEHGLGWGWTAARVARAIMDPSVNVAVLTERDRLDGFGIMQYLDDGNAHLVLLAISPAWRHQRRGRHLLRWLEQTAQVAGGSEIRLECRADNRNALAFYQHLGYQQIGTVSGYYEGRVDAAQLRKC